MALPSVNDLWPVAPQGLTLTGTRSTRFSVPSGMKVATVITPNLTTSTSVVLETLTPTADGSAGSAWVPLEVFNLTDGSLVALDGITESKAITIPVSAMGGGILSFTCADAQTALTIWLIWSRDG